MFKRSLVTAALLVFGGFASAQSTPKDPVKDPVIAKRFEETDKTIGAICSAINRMEEKIDKLPTPDKTKAEELDKLKKDLASFSELAKAASGELKDLRASLDRKNVEGARLKNSLDQLWEKWKLDEASSKEKDSAPIAQFKMLRERFDNTVLQTTVMASSWQNKFPRQAWGRLVASENGKQSPLVGKTVDVYRQVLDQKEAEWKKVDSVKTDEGGKATYNIPDDFKSWPKDTYLVFKYAGDDNNRTSNARVKVR